jgi:hypothetical protein
MSGLLFFWWNYKKAIAILQASQCSRAKAACLGIALRYHIF